MKNKYVQLVQISIEDMKIIMGEVFASELRKANDVIPLNLKPETEILTREQTKNLLGISYVSLWKYNKEGILTGRKIKGRIFYLRQDINNMLNQVA